MWIRNTAIPIGCGYIIYLGWKRFDEKSKKGIILFSQINEGLIISYLFN